MADGVSFQDLLRRVRSGDQDAARELVEHYEPAIRRAVRFRLADTRLAKIFDSMDICQSVLASFFVRAAEGQFEIADPKQLIKLLVAMARNKLAMHARAQGRQRRDYRRVQAGSVEMHLLTADDPSPSQQVSGKELLEHAERLLTPDERELVALRKEGMEWDAIAAKLGGSAEALRKKLARAVDRVAHRLNLDDYHHE
jgi:RNA polymerase sigma-70 factor (ECF subfamily)